MRETAHLQLGILLADAVPVVYCVARRPQGVDQLLQSRQAAGHLEHQPLDLARGLVCGL